MISEKPLFEIELHEKTYRLYCDNDCPVGGLHDALMMMKGIVVEKMQAAQQEEEDISKKMQEINSEQEEYIKI